MAEDPKLNLENLGEAKECDRCRRGVRDDDLLASTMAIIVSLCFVCCWGRSKLANGGSFSGLSGGVSSISSGRAHRRS